MASHRVTTLDVSQPAQWHQTERQEKYLCACLNAEIPRTITARAAAAGVSRQSVYKWLQTPEFREWLSTQRRLAFEHSIDDVKQRCVELAVQGSPEHIRIVLELSGELGRGAHQYEPRAVGVFINVPRPASGDDSNVVAPVVTPFLVGGPTPESLRTTIWQPTTGKTLKCRESAWDLPANHLRSVGGNRAWAPNVAMRRMPVGLIIRFQEVRRLTAVDGPELRFDRPVE
jgi:hypothetical protein